MYYSLFTLTALISCISASLEPAPTISSVTTISSPSPSSSTIPGTLGLGATCNQSSDCANGADCYGVTSFTIKTCGSFQSSCTSDAQCATNTCQGGFCSGFLASSLFRITTTATATATSSSTLTVAATSAISSGTLGLGAICKSSSDCANGANCYGVTSFTITTCGSFQASCSSDNQCATNTCQNGTCSGFLASSLYKITSTSTTVARSTSTASVTASAMTPTTSSSRPSSTLAPFTGAATKERVEGIVAVVAMVAIMMT